MIHRRKGQRQGLFLRKTDQSAAVSLAQSALPHHVEQGLRQREQAQGVGDGAAGAADAEGDLLLGEGKLLHQTAIAGGLLNGVEVFALEVLDQRDLELFSSLELAQLHRKLGEAGHAGGAPAALPCHKLIPAVSEVSDQQGLQHPVAGNGIGKLSELLLVEFAAGLLGIRFDG